MSYHKKKIILHIGLNKTGSTFLQESITSIRHENYHIDYDDILTTKLIKYLKIPTKEIKDDLLKVINNIKEKNILITSEGIAAHHYNGFSDVKKKFELIEDLFNKPKYIIFFREPSAIIYSGYFQRLQKKHDLLFEDYINKDLNELYTSSQLGFFQTNYKVFNYNNIFKDYLNIQNRVLFIEYEKFFREKNGDILNNFTELNVPFNFDKKVNRSLKNLIYLEFYSKFFLFKYVKIIWIQFNKLFFKYRKAREVSLRLIILINFLIKITPRKYIKEIDDKHQSLLEEIKNYHSENYREFKNKINSIQKN